MNKSELNRFYLDRVLNKKYLEVFTKNEIKLIEQSPQKTNKILIDKLDLTDISLRISYVNCDLDPCEQTVIKQEVAIFEEFCSEDFLNSNLYGSLNKMLIIAVIKGNCVGENHIIGYIDFKSNLQVLSAIKEEYISVLTDIKRVVFEKNLTLSSNMQVAIVFKPKDAKPYKPIISKTGLSTLNWTN